MQCHLSYMQVLTVKFSLLASSISIRAGAHIHFTTQNILIFLIHVQVLKKPV